MKPSEINEGFLLVRKPLATARLIIQKLKDVFVTLLRPQPLSANLTVKEPSSLCSKLIFFIWVIFYPVAGRTQVFYQSLEDKLAFVDSAARVSLAFASEDIRSPISSFGHSFLVFHNEVTPEVDAVVLEFAGNIREDFFVFKSLLTSIEGRYLLTTFHHKTTEYDFEGRDVWLAPLILSKQEKLRLKQRVSRQIGQPFPYNFFTNNCSDYIHRMVVDSLEAHRCEEAVFTIPSESLARLGECGRLGRFERLAARSTQFLEIYDELSADQQAMIGQIDFNLKPNPDIQLEPMTRQALSLLINYRVPRSRHEFQRENMLKWKALVVEENQPSHSNPPQSDPYKRIGSLGLGYNFSAGSYQVHLKPALHYFENVTEGSFWSDTLEVGHIGISGNGEQVELDQFTLFHLHAKQSSMIIRDGFTRLLYLGYKRDLYQDLEVKKTTARFGLGHTWALSKSLKVSPLLVAEGGHYASSVFSGGDASVSVRLDLDMRLYRSWRMRVSYEDYFGTHELYDNLMTTEWSLFDVGQGTLTATAMLANDFSEKGLLLKFNWFY